MPCEGPCGDGNGMVKQWLVKVNGGGGGGGVHPRLVNALVRHHTRACWPEATSSPTHTAGQLLQPKPNTQSTQAVKLRRPCDS